MEERRYTVYAHTNLSNGKKYIGITRKKPEYRWDHGEGYRTQPLFYKAIQKYGWDGFSHDIIATRLTKAEAEWVEKDLISFYSTRDRNLGYNIATGGYVSHRYATEEEAEAAKKAVAKRSREKTKDKRNAETRVWRANNLGHVKEYKREYYHRTKKLNGKRPPLSEETKKKISTANSKAVSAFKDGELVATFNSFTEAEKAFNVNHANICRAIRKGTKCGGYNWAYAEGGEISVNN